MAYIYDLVDTWNNSGVTFTAIKMNVTDTASASGSLLMDLQVGGVSRFAVRKDGFIQIGGSSTGISNYFSTVGIYQGGTLAAAIGSTGGVRTQTVFTFGNSEDVILSRRGVGNLRLGAADAASAVPQILSVQSVATGTTNGAGANFTITGSQGTGTGAGGSIIFQVAPASDTSGSSQNPLVTAMTIDSTRKATFATTIQATGYGNSSDAALAISQSSLGFYRGAYQGDVAIYVTTQGNDVAAFLANGPIVSKFGLSITESMASASDVFLVRDAPNTLALRNGTSRQTFRVYNSTDGTNSEFFRIQWNANDCTIGTDKAGAGVNKALLIRSSGQINLTPDTTLYFGGGSNPQWQVGSNGHLLAYTDNISDIGSKSSGRPRHIYTTGNITAAKIGAGTDTPEYTLHVVGDSFFDGNVTISGLTSFMNAETLLVGDNYIVLNADLPNTSPALESAGIEVKRGTSGNAAIIWDETSSEWDIRANNVTVAAFTQSGSIKANTGVALTVSNPVLDLAQTWNNSGVAFTGMKFNVISDTSAAGSLLLDLQIGGNSRFKVSKTPHILFGTATGDAAFTEGIYASNWLSLGGTNNATVLLLRSGIAVLRSDTLFSWSNNTSFSSQDLFLGRRGAGQLRLGAADTSASSTITVTIASPGVVTWTNHGLSTGSPVIFTTTGALPTGINSGTTYYAIVVDANTFQLATTFANALAGTAVNTSGSQSGTHTARRGAIAQTFGPQDTLSTSSLENIDGADFVIRGSRSIGNKPGGSIVFQVSPAGTSGTAQNALINAVTINSSGLLQFLSSSQSYIGDLGAAGPFLAVTNLMAIGYTTSTVRLSSGTSFGFTSGGPTLSLDTILVRDDANALALRNGTNAQTFNIYNTYTDSSNHEKGFIRWNSNRFEFGTVSLGTGTTRITTIYNRDKAGSYGPRIDLRLEADGGGASKALSFSHAGGIPIQWGIDGSYVGSFSSQGFSAGTADFGGSANSSAGIDAGFSRIAQYVVGVMARPAGSYIGCSLEFLENTAPANPAANRVRFYAEDDGAGNTQQSLLFSGGETFKFRSTGFMSIGGITSAFPALKRSGTTLQARLADDSGFATLDGILSMEGTAPASASATGTAGELRYDGDYVYVCVATNTWKRTALTTW